MQRYKRVCAFLLAAVLLTSLAPLRSAAEQEGKAEATLYLSTAEDFLRFAENCTLDSYSVGLTVYLRADISLAGTEFGGVPTFGGEFLGGGHTVSGLTITDNISNAGLFRYLQPGATIKELKVIGSLAPSGSAANIGGIVGNNSGLVTGCSFTGSVTGADNVGGIVGVNQKSGTVKNCRSFGYVGGEHYTGGVAGMSSGLMEGCTNAAAVNTEGKEVTLDLENFDLTEFTINSTENVDAYTDAGGIVGYSNGVVLDCVNSGTVGYEHMGYNCGGIAGRQSGYLDGCRNLGTVYGRKEVGGIVGQMEPYTELDPNSTSAENLKRQFSTLSELVNKTLQDTQGASDALTGRLNTVNGYMNGVAEDMGILGEQTSDFVDANIGSVNDITDRVDYVMDGLPDILKDMENANAFLRAALGDLSLVNEDLNIFGKMQGAGAEYDETDYDILTIVSGTGGTVTPDIVNPAAGATVTLTIDVAEGYTLADADLRIQCAASGYENAAPGSVKPKESVGFALVPDDAAANRYYCIFTMPGDASDPVNSTARNTAVYVDFQAVVPEPLAGCVIDTNEGGSVTASPAAPAADALVTLTVAPNRGYQLQSLTVTSADGSAMPITKVDDPGTAYTFTMPGDYAYVSAVFAHMTDRSTVGKARDDMNAASAELSAAMARLENSAAALRAELQKTSPDFTKVRELLGTFATDAAAAGSAAGDLIAAVNTLTNVLTPYVEDAAVAANRDLGSALKNLNEMSGYLGGALTKTREIFEYLNALPDIEFTPLGDDFRENLDSLNANLKGMTDNLNLLNQEFSKYSTIIISDLTAVNNQFNVVMLLLVDVISGVANVTADFKFTDVSEEDAANSTLGKVSGSVNLGSVYGDLNVGGIAGAMAVEYDFDPETSVAGGSKANLTSAYLTHCVLTGCDNRGEITAKKDGVGGIVGYMDLGLCTDSLGCGVVKSESGDYLGGIAGDSRSIIRDCWAVCTLSGDDMIGGVAGRGFTVTGCRAMVEIESGDESLGAIAGAFDSEGEQADNLFVSTTLAGVDGVSYAKSAAPVTYEELAALPGAPVLVTDLTLTFVADGKTVRTLRFRYGESVALKDVPQVPEKAGYSGEWPEFDYSCVTFSRTLTALYTSLSTALGSDVTRGDAALPVLLVEGSFHPGASVRLDAAEEAAPPLAEKETALESWSVRVRDVDPQGHGHRVHYLVPETEGVGALTVYVCEDDLWRSASYVKEGRYLIFDVESDDFLLSVAGKPVDNTRYLIIGAVLAALLLLLISSAIRGRIVKKRAAKAQNAREAEETAQAGIPS